MTRGARESVTVQIAGEEHTIRSNAEPEYTVRCADYVDRRIAEIKKQVGMVDVHKLAILAALSITDELFQARETKEKTGSLLAERVGALADRIERTLSDE